jgi:hypothetical protein
VVFGLGEVREQRTREMWFFPKKNVILMLILFMLISDDIYVIEKIVNGTFFFLP